MKSQITNSSKYKLPRRTIAHTKVTTHKIINMRNKRTHKKKDSKEYRRTHKGETRKRKEPIGRIIGTHPSTMET